MKFKFLFLLVLSLGFRTTLAAADEIASSILHGTQENSPVSGEFVFEDTDKGLNVRGKVTGLSPGKHGFHVHEYGSCGDSGKEAGSHFNPQGAAHGFLPKQKLQRAHAGDFGNLEADEKGTASIDLTLPGLTVSGNPFAVAGRALIIHENADDFSQPVGNAGSRVGCGLITVTKKPEISDFPKSNPGK